MRLGLRLRETPWLARPHMPQEIDPFLDGRKVSKESSDRFHRQALVEVLSDPLLYLEQVLRPEVAAAFDQFVVYDDALLRA